METPQLSFTTRQLSFDEIFSLFKDITSGVAYLHSNEYIHRDLKPNNCLLHREGGRLRCLISDFGEVQPEHVVRKSSGSTGTISYCAPEVLKMNASGHYGNFTTKSDIFSLGMILYFMCFGKLPYRSSNAIQEELEDIDELRDEITGWQGFHEERRERPDLPSHLYILLKKLLSLKPAERPSASEVLSAMRGEIHFENINRTDRDQRSNLSLRVNRVQNLDSPATPSTPVNDPQKPLGRPRPSPLNSSQIVPSPSKFDQPSLALDDGSDQRLYSPIQNPEHPPAMTIAEMTDEENDDQSSQLNFETDARRPSRPLLMPPPTTRAAALRHRVSIMAQQTAELVGVDRDLPNHLFRLSFFFVKIVSLFRPCYPYMANWEIALPLVMIAVLDLRVPRASEDDALARRNAGDEIEFGAPPPPPFRGIGASVMFLLLHLAVLATASNWDALCTVSPNQEWSDWYMRSTIPSTFSSATADLE
uniref:Protein kinase domain-containing protein n=1 Tax=Bionectria ochroleuca TaxID=29856 RepID=A0A8H7NH39_BIOOC